MIGQIDAEHGGDQDYEYQAREAEESARHVEPIEYLVDSEIGGIVQGDFTCVKGDGEIMIITGASMREWTREIIAQRRRAVMEEDARQRTLHDEEYSLSVNNLSPQEHMSMIEAISKYPEARTETIEKKQITDDWTYEVWAKLPSARSPT